MEVILKENVPALGQAGDIVKVSRGYARNYLLPCKLAVFADPNNVKELEHHRRLAETKRAKLKQEAQTLAERLSQLTLTLSQEAGEEGKLFGSVTTKDIAAALLKEQITIDRKQIHLQAPLRQLGDVEVALKIHPEVSVNIKVCVVRK